MTLLPRANSWWVGANIPGKPRNLYPYVGGVGTYRLVCDEVAARDYDGFTKGSDGATTTGEFSGVARSAFIEIVSAAAAARNRPLARAGPAVRPPHIADQVPAVRGDAPVPPRQCPAPPTIGDSMPLHPEAQQLLAALDAAGLPPFEHMTVPQAREAARGFTDLQGEPEEIATEDRPIPGPAGEIPVRDLHPGR